jgi:chromosome segregation ATPase
MTVPGKGGRPRKWRSDADRVRAYRARQQGVEEPPVLSIALDDGDDLARAWDTIRQLQTQLAGENEVRQRLRKELNAARRQLDQQQERFGWIEKARTVLQGERDALVAERGELRAELNTLRRRIDAADERPAAISLAPSATIARPLSRAERRRLDREHQRRERKLQ